VVLIFEFIFYDTFNARGGLWGRHKLIF